MNMPINIITILTLALSFNTFSYETSPQVITLPLSSEKNSVSLSFNGAIFDSDNAPLISESSSNEINVFIYKIIQANKNKSPEEILKLWQPEDKNEIKSLMSNAKYLERNSAFFRNIKNSRLMGYIEYGDFIICYIEHDVKGMSSLYLKSYSIIIDNNKLFQTNKLSNSFIFANIGYELGKFIWPNEK